MKIFLFIDGTNLYSAQYKLFGPSSFLDFSCFIKKIEEALHISFFQIHFYASYSPQNNILTSKDKLYLKNEALFYKSAKSVPQLQFLLDTGQKQAARKRRWMSSWRWILSTIVIKINLTHSTFARATLTLIMLCK